jgi:hypothetical protein
MKNHLPIIVNVVQTIHEKNALPFLEQFPKEANEEK